jgi:capsular polysaccharide transport system ATP-binding protein
VADPVFQFVAEFGELAAVMDVPVKYLAPKAIQVLNLALFYGAPCDYYLFDQRITLGPRDLQRRTWEAFSQRSKQAGVILTTSLPKEALKLGDSSGAILHRGKITFFEDVEDAIEVFSTIPPDVHSTNIKRRVEEPADEPEFDY